MKLHPITLETQKYICPSNAINGDNVGRVMFLWTFVKFWNQYFGTTFTESDFSYSFVGGASNAFDIDGSTGELTVQNISNFTSDSRLIVRVSIGGMYMDTICTILRINATDCVYFDSTYDGSAGTGNGTRERPYLKYNGSGLGYGMAGKTYLWRRNTVTETENVVLINSKVGGQYPEYINLAAWGQGERPVMDMTHNTVSQEFLDVGIVPWGNDPINESDVCNNLRVFDIETTQDDIESTNYSILVKQAGDNLEFHRLKLSKTSYDHGIIYFVSSFAPGNVARNIYLNSIEIYDTYHRGIKIETGGVVGYNFKCINSVETAEHPAPNAAFRANVELKFIYAEVLLIGSGDLGIQIRSNGHKYEWCYLKNFAYALTTYIHQQSIDDEDNKVYGSYFKNIIVEGAQTASYFGRQSGTTDLADGIKFINILLLNCANGFQVSQGAINTAFIYCNSSNTGNDGIRVFTGAGENTKIINCTSFGNASNDIEISRGQVEVINCNYGVLAGTPTIITSNTSTDEDDLIGAGTDLGYNHDLIGNPVPSSPSIGAYELQVINGVTSECKILIDIIEKKCTWL